MSISLFITYIAVVLMFNVRRSTSSASASDVQRATSVMRLQMTYENIIYLSLHNYCSYVNPFEHPCPKNKYPSKSSNIACRDNNCPCSFLLLPQQQFRTRDFSISFLDIFENIYSTKKIRTYSYDELIMAKTWTMFKILTKIL